jgi:hypothetical protein
MDIRYTSVSVRIYGVCIVLSEDIEVAEGSDGSEVTGGFTAFGRKMIAADKISTIEQRMIQKAGLL